MIRHVVAWKFQPGTEAQMHKFLNALRALDGVIPELKAMQVGVDCAGGGNFDACLIADFDDLAALDRYKNDPRHVAASGLCKSIRETRIAVDFEICQNSPRIVECRQGRKSPVEHLANGGRL